MADDLTRYRELLKTFLIESEADDVLATRIPWLCPDCEGSSRRVAYGEEYTGEVVACGTTTCAHPNAPTIGERLTLADRADEALHDLEPWDMLTLDPHGHGEVTDDAPWARHLIAWALRGEATP